MTTTAAVCPRCEREAQSAELLAYGRCEDCFAGNAAQDDRAAPRRAAPPPSLGTGSAARLLLRIAASLPPEPFSLEELTVAAWRRAPEAFALKGHPEHPDARRVATRLCGPKSLVARGELERVGPNVFVVTELGRKAAGG